MKHTPKHTNSLANESSPYLLQHAHNPVNWFPWGEEALQKAKNENKPLIISIGYSACHWCHVMERESFENTEVAALMNANFVCIKVDREERPDVDAIYMNAVQLMNGQGGWPLNCFALPNGKPFYGGTYFPKHAWMQVLQNVDTIYKTQPGKVLEYAERLSEGIRSSELMEKNKDAVAFELSHLDLLVENWKKHFDNAEGGPDRAPKFPLPNNYLFLLRYAHLKKDETLLQHVNLTLEKMACGGIYDQVGGGFARYSTDKLWKVPHFEKMLYDNAQLVSLYSEAYQLTKNPLYKEVVFETLEFVERELTSPEHSFYSALDADSEGEEGKFYVWKKEDLQELLKEDFEFAAAFFCVSEKGFWEHGNYILMRTITQSDDEKKKRIKATLLASRNKRTRPGLDDKQLTSWNALMLKGYVDAYRIFREEKFLNAAVENANFILQKQKKSDGGLWHTYKNGKCGINGFLEDYCFTMEALLALYEVTFDLRWLNETKQFADYCFTHFYSERNGMFFFTSDKDERIVARKSEVNDNVIPASNSSLAKSLFQLGKLFDDDHYLNTAQQMLHNVKPAMAAYGSAYSNWAMLELNFVFPFYEVVICGKNAQKKSAELEQHFIPNKLLCGATEKKTEKNLPLTQGKFTEDKTLIYVCVNKTCRMPHETVSDAMEEMK
ncbi:MAG: hypothetical protein POELPBGB_01855 [Bacteroidia bacterium]|nr:hypothetical protein [Bacteroidia bacterium]